MKSRPTPGQRPRASAALERVLAREEPPLRSELFSAGQMGLHGGQLALSHRLARGGSSDRLLGRLAENERLLGDVCDLATRTLAAGRRVSPGAEWLLDNFHLVEEQIRTARRHLPKGYCRGLPRLAAGASAGQPRVYDVAFEAISHGDGRVDAESLARFVASYQEVNELELGELWALPIMLRLGLIENLRRVGARIAAGILDRDRAGAWADQMTQVAERDPKGLILVIADMVRSDPPMASPFVAELARRLQGHSAALALPLTWIEQRLAESGTSIEQLVQAEAQAQAGVQVTMGNTIGSLRALGAVDWRDFVEGLSGVERELGQDPAGTYRLMDFATRDRYRHVVETIARRGGLGERAVARAAVRLASAHAADERAGHVGYYLVDGGMPALERVAGVRASAAAALARAARRHALPLYLGAMAAITLALATGLVAHARSGGVAGALLGILAVLALLAASQLASGLVNWLATLLVAPRALPRMDFTSGIPEEARTLVVVPALLTDAPAIAGLLEALEVRFLGNRDANLHFALLTDFADAAAETQPQDDALLGLAREGIEELEERHGRPGTFFLFHRARRWNPHEGTWMGSERKRGKLADLNAFLRGGRGRFALVVGEVARLRRVRYVITLDADTQLPREAARRFVAAMAHPLNRARFGEPGRPGEARRVIAGYGILQPRVSASLAGSGRSWYARLHGGDAGIDPYTRAVSDVYQDLFGEGSFIGKGIYDVDAFEASLEGRLPADRILSHDLLEGCHARSGSLSDDELHEEYPSTYAADMDRRHRWVRGDWQLAGWLRARVPGPSGRLPNALSGLSQWKILDNMRRSLVAPGLVALLLLGWTLLPGPWLWTAAALCVLLVPAASALAVDLLRRPEEVSVRRHLAATSDAAGRHAARAVLALSFLPCEAAVNADAIMRTTWRTLVSHRRRLEWNPSSAGGSAASAALWAPPALALATAALLAWTSPAALVPAAPLLALWLAAPFLAWWAGRPLARPEARLTAEQATFLRKLGRRTWAFFETYVGPGDHWLPPDNFQEHPVGSVAHRTSPTNMGLALLANLTAYDLGYVPAGTLLDRCAATLEAMRTLERHRGHFYNWYDTQSMKPLAPLYVSAVDSGNLAGHLMTLRAGLLALADEDPDARRWFEGLRDTARILEEALGGAAPGTVAVLLSDVEALCASPPPAADAIREGLGRVRARAAGVLAEAGGSAGSEAGFWAAAFDRQAAALSGEVDGLAGGARHAGERRARIARLAQQCEELARMEYGFLYDRARHLLAVGYNVSEGRLDASRYDLLASEARLASFVAISQGELPQESWFALGRRLTTAEGQPVLLSWSGSMFEYLMPQLVMPTYEHTLLDLACRVSVESQVAYGKRRGVAWGVSESGYNSIDASLQYQYRAFGVPGLGMKRGLAEDLVVAPYASALALLVAPEAACRNLQRLSTEGLAGRFGLYEAVDHTPARLPRGQASAVVRSFMAHHQGMILVALGHVLLDRPMQKRFASEPAFKASLLLLQERVPKVEARGAHPAQRFATRGTPGGPEAPVRVIATPDTAAPEVQLLSNGRYHVMVTNAGGGSSRWKDLAVTRWREDATCDPWGTFCYIRDVEGGRFWSTAHQPTRARAEGYQAIFSEARAEFRRRDAGLETHTEIVVSPEDDIELRRVRITNRSRVRRVLEVTSYAEVVLAPAAADALHPAFSSLFVQTEFAAGREAILCHRRPRSPAEPVPWMFHLMAVHDVASLDLSHETDRMAFVGRGGSLAAPAAMLRPGPLAGGQGSVLDPVVAIRHRIALEPQQTATIDVATGMADTRDEALALAAKCQDRRLADRVFDLASTHSGVALRQINATEADAQVYSRLASCIVYANAALRAEAAVLLRNRRGQTGLWGYAISGDLPIVLLQVSDPESIELVRRVVQAHAYWRLKGLAVDLVIWNEDRGGYRQAMQDQIMGLIAAGLEANAIDRPGGIFVRRAEQIPDEDRILFQSVARAILSDRRGSLEDQVARRGAAEVRIPALVPTRPRGERAAQAPGARALILDNGLGGFTPDGTEYVITTRAGESTPAPWCNVLANPDFATVVSESGVSCTWSENAHEFRLTPWHNDSVGEASGEALYLRDEETGFVWSPAPMPCRGSGAYVTRHGFGYSVFEHDEDGIHTELWVYVAIDAPVKISLLKVRNHSGRARRLSATGYAEWVLGDLRPKTAMHVVTEVEPAGGALLARNPFSADFSGRVAFLDVDDSVRSVSGDRAEFLGRNGAPGDPAAMSRTRLSGRVGAGLDPCAAIQVPFDLADGQERELAFRLGAGRDAAHASELVRRFRGSAAARSALDAVRAHWKRVLGAVHVRTPDAAFDVLANGWLVYQAIACRLWARGAHYQPGGAYGFRDQLQDVMALVHAEPALARAQLARCAARQFAEGDVQHWWHPPSGRGVRTRCSDDYLWLPFAAARYVKATGDWGVLDEPAEFLEGRAVGPGDDSYYDLPRRSAETASLYEHCVRAIRHGLRFGAHGLPLMGSGDWNDGMNRVGIEGRGESVWLGFFLCAVLEQFAQLARARGDAPFAQSCEAERERLRASLERHAWDGEWYRRAYFDDGTPLGSASNDECRIDSVSQSWAVLSGAAAPLRAREAMAAVAARLVRPEHALVQLLHPPFDRSSLDPGYIRGYVPGVRENGGQYTHAAIWAAMAFAALDDGERAWELAAMINPANRTRTPEGVAAYKVEPYVLAADVYAVEPHAGRGGWTWYTGSAAWMYRLMVESILGLAREGERLRLTPCLPADWPECTIRYRCGAALYEIVLRQVVPGPAERIHETRLTLDGVLQPDDSIGLVDDGGTHRVEVALANERPRKSLAQWAARTAAR